jgi:hypothetical protein
MKKIRTDWIENRTARNEVIRQPVDVWAPDNATDEIFKGIVPNVPAGPGAGSRVVNAEPPAGPGFEDATFRPTGDCPSPKPPRAAGGSE